MTDVSPAVVPASAPGSAASSTDAAVRRDTPLLTAAAAMWVRELRARMRGKKAFVFITIYLSLLVGLLWLGLRTIEGQYLGALDQIAVGRGIFTAVVLLETLVVVALAPAYTAGSISQEREKQTFDLLAITPISSLAIVVGKLLSGLSYLGLLVGVSVPLASIAFLFGGIEAGTVLVSYLIVAVAAAGVGAIGIACSAIMRRTQAATVTAFLVVGTLVVGASVGWLVYNGLASARQVAPAPEALLYLNPFLAQADLICAATGNMCLFGVTVGVEAARDGQFLDAEQVAPMSGGFWPKTVIAWVLVTLAAAFVATQALAPTRRWRPGRRPARRVTR